MPLQNVVSFHKILRILTRNIAIKACQKPVRFCRNKMSITPVQSCVCLSPISYVKMLWKRTFLRSSNKLCILWKQNLATRFPKTSQSKESEWKIQTRNQFSSAQRANMNKISLQVECVFIKARVLANTRWKILNSSHSLFTLTFCQQRITYALCSLMENFSPLKIIFVFPIFLFVNVSC